MPQGPTERGKGYGVEDHAHRMFAPSKYSSQYAQSDYSRADVERSYAPSFKKLLALSWIAFIAILGPFHPMISSFLSSSSSVAMKNFSSYC